MLEFMMKENDISKLIINCCYEIHSQLGPGLLECVYEEILYTELSELGLNLVRQKCVPLKYNSRAFDIGFRIDLLVESKVIVELKSVEKLLPVHKKQLLTYLKITQLKLGLLINFNCALIKDGIVRIVNNL
jgi:GxxExxY protein